MQQGDDFDWLRSRGRTTSSFTGPSFDHTLSSALGYYMFIESSAPRVPGDKARLYSEVFKPTRDTKCFNFYYNMNGADVGTLNVYLLVNQSRDVFSTEALVWSLQGDNGDQWGMGQFNITSRYTAYPYQVGIYGKLSKIPNTSLILFSNKMLVVGAGFHKRLVRIANREDPDQMVSEEAVLTGSALFV